jgi:hypothetical protein
MLAAVPFDSEKNQANKAHLPFALLQVLALGSSKTFVTQRE